jgi:hypothetical protein
MEGIIAEGAEMIEEEGDPEVKDAGLISAAQRVEHYEIVDRLLAASPKIRETQEEGPTISRRVPRRIILECLKNSRTQELKNSRRTASRRGPRRSIFEYLST